MKEFTHPRRCEFSDCRQYRYTLWREWWQGNLPSPKCRDCADNDGFCPTLKRRCDPSSYLMVIGLNPSTADETKDDPTIRRCIGFAKARGLGALCMTNLFAWRDTKPAAMKAAMFPVGGDNDMWLRRAAEGASIILAAWGAHGSFLDRGQTVAADMRKLGRKLYMLKLNKDGSPMHPLYVPAATEPIEF